MEFFRPYLEAKTVQIMAYSSLVISPLESISFTTVIEILKSAILARRSLSICMHLRSCAGETGPVTIRCALAVVHKLLPTAAANMAVLNSAPSEIRMVCPPRVTAAVGTENTFTFAGRFSKRGTALPAAARLLFLYRMASAPALYGINRKIQFAGYRLVSFPAALKIGYEFLLIVGHVIHPLTGSSREREKLMVSKQFF